MNAVYLEMVKLGRRWLQEVKNNPEAITFILLGHKPENQLFETYFKYQLSDESKTDDTYMIYYQPFENKNSYGQSLLREIREVHDEWQKSKDLSADGWASEGVGSPEDADQYIASMVGLTNTYPVLKQNRIFIHLAPTAISDKKDFGKWMMACGKAIENQGAGGYMKLVFTDHEGYQTVKEFYKPHFWKHPVDIGNLMDKAAESTNREKGAAENNFQQLILKAGNFMGRQQYADADAVLTHAVQVSTKNRFTQGLVLAKLLKAQNKQATSHHAEAENLYLQAEDHARDHADLLTQVYFTYGSFLLSQKKKERAIDIFNKVAVAGEQKGDLFLQIEAHRLIGQTQNMGALSNSPVPHYEKCIELGETMDAELLRETSIPYIATLLMKKYGGGSQKAIELDAKMKDWFGDDWRALATIPDLKKFKKN